MPTVSLRDEADTAELSLEMMVRAYQALATLYDRALPGKYVDTHKMMKDYLTDNLRMIEQGIDTGHISEAAFKAAILRIREILLGIENDICYVDKKEGGIKVNPPPVSLVVSSL